MKKRMAMKLLSELLRNSKRSDGQLAKALGVSQPTITRIRTRLVNEGIIQGSTIVPDLIRMGYEIMTVMCFKTKLKAEPVERAAEWATAIP